jgi:hypothetical protein
MVLVAAASQTASLLVGQIAAVSSLRAPRVLGAATPITPQFNRIEALVVGVGRKKQEHGRDNIATLACMSTKARWIVGLALGTLLVGSAASWLRSSPCCSSSKATAAGKLTERSSVLPGVAKANRLPLSEEELSSPRAILSRAWFDAYPEKATDVFTLALYFSGGIGVYRTGSMYKNSIEFFEFERRGKALDLTLLQDKKAATTTFEIKACDDKPPFDLCLTLAQPVRGPKTLYGFAYEDDEAANLPWVQSIKREALTQK